MTKQLRLLTMAAMVLLAACDEGTDTVAPSVTGSVAGTATIDGAGAAGVVVTLNSGQTATTGATGTYTIAAVPAGSYIATITGFPADVAFSTTSKGAVVATAGQVVTVDFSGSRIRTSAIFGSVTSSGVGLAGITATLTGPETKTATTDAGGQFSAAGLRAGTYTVAISGVPATVTCATTSQSVVVAAGESKVAAFACTANATARISGILYIDENNQNLLYDGVALESALAAANVAITLEGPTIGLRQTKQTDAVGAFSFIGLAAGSYSITIDAADVDIPAGYAYGGVAPANVTATATVVLAAGASGTVNYAFRITRQTIKVYSFLGRDVSPAPAGVSTSIPRGVAPLAGVILDLYPTQTDAVGSTNSLGRDTTDVNGEAQFNFLRTADTSPSGATQDQIVVAQFVATPNAEHVVNGETRLEIRYSQATATGLAADTFDVLNTRSTFAFDANSSTGKALAGWSTALWVNDTTVITSQNGLTNAAGRQVFTDAMAVASLPDTFYMRLSGTQAAAGAHAFVQTPVAQRGTVVQKSLRWIHNGTTTRADTVDVGDEVVNFADADLVVRVYHERDDTTAGGRPKYTAGDNIENADNIEMALSWRQTGAATDSTRTVVAGATGVITFANIPTALSPYKLNARSIVANQVVLLDTTTTVGQGGANGDLSGGEGSSKVYTLGANTTAGHAAFGFKYNNGNINGRVKAADSTAATGLIVSLVPAVGNIQGSTARTDTTDATGLFGWTGLLEGKYTVSVAGNATWLAVTTAVTDTLQNNNDIDILNLIVRRLDTSIKGVVVNDRDADNVVDVGDALPGVTMTLYRDGSGAITLDTLVTTQITDANGAYQFNALPEGRYIVKATQPAGTAVVMSQGFAAGVPIDTTVVTTKATTTGEGANNTRTVGTITPVPLPAWNYSTSTVAFNGRTHFTFLLNNTRAFGVITLTAGGAVVPNMSVTLRRCLVSSGAAKPPAGPALCQTYMPIAATNAGPTTITTDGTGTFTYNNLQEGVYEIVPNAATVGLTGTTPSSRLFLQSGSQDINRGDYSAF